MDKTPPPPAKRSAALSENTEMRICNNNTTLATFLDGDREREMDATAVNDSDEYASSAASNV